MKKILVLGLMMGMAKAVLAGTPTITVYGEEVVVTATRVEKGIGDVPVSASVVTRDEMEKRSRVTFVDEALRYEAGLVQKRTKFADAMSRGTLRGFSGGQRTLVLLDGMPINDSYGGGTYLCNLPVGDVQRIEVVKGPFSNLYGGEAMGGVIHIITQSPAEEAFEVKSSVSAFNTYCHILNYGNKIGKLGFSINLEKKASEGDRSDLVTKSVNSGTSTTTVTGWTKTTDSKGSSTYLIGNKGKNYWDQNQYGCKLIYDLSPASNLSFSFKGNSREYGYRDSQSSLVDTTTGKPVDNSTVTFPGEGTATISQKDFLGGWGVAGDNTYGLGYDGLLSGITLKGRLNYIDADSFSVDPQSGANYSGGPGKLSRTSPRDMLFGEVQVDIPFMESNLITGGLSFRNDSAKARDWKVSSWKDESSTIGDVSYEVGGKARTIALYTQGEVQLLDTLKLFPGARYDTWKRYDASLLDGTRSTRYADRDAAAFSSKLGLLYKPKFEKGLYELDGLRASWGKAFRPPTAYELYRTWVSSDKKTYVGNPELSPETTQSWEVGIDQHVGKITLSGTYFQSKIDDLIYRRWITNTRGVVENGCGKIAGFEIEGKMKIAAGLSAFANYTLQDTEMTYSTDPKTVGKDFEYVPEKMANIGLSFYKNRLDASCVWHFVDKMYANSDNRDVVEGVYGAYDTVNTVDMKIGYAFKEDMRLSVACDNLLDREYYQYYKAPGRTVTIEVGCKY